MTRLSLTAGLATIALLAGCMAPMPESGPYPVEPGVPVQSVPGPKPSPDMAARNFVAVVQRMEPVAERECRARTRGLNCDFQIVVDDRPGQAPNAFQTVDSAGRPVIAFNLALIAEARNTDELAFVMGHEAGHHLAEHIPRQGQSAMAGALILGTLASVYGGDPTTVQTAQNIGATVGARRYSKEFELEADAIGTILAYRAGYDPERGAAFFSRIPDPGNRFLGTHPPNAQRIDMVRRTLAGLRAGRV